MKMKRACLQSKEGAFEFATVPVSSLRADLDTDFWRRFIGKETAGRTTKESFQNPSPESSPKSSPKSQDICQSVLPWTLKILAAHLDALA